MTLAERALTDENERDSTPAPAPAEPSPVGEIVSGESIGPVSLGDSLGDVEAELGSGHQDDPNSSWYEFDVTGGTLGVVFEDQRGAIVISTDSRRFSYSDASPALDLREVSQALPDWETETCPDGESGEVRLLEPPKGPVTVFEFQKPPTGPGMHSRVYIAADQDDWSVCRGE